MPAPSPAVPPSPRTPTTGARLAAESRQGAVRERFLREIVARVPLTRVAEVHLFPPVRQGSVEGGVAVVAATLAEGQAPPAAPRHTVYTARYRLTVRGPDRGRWHVDVREEADAPLVTVDAVVRGVQRRAGDATPPARLDAADVARAVDGGAAAAAPHAA